MQTHYPPSHFVVPSPLNPALQLHLKDPSSFWHVAFKWQLWGPSTHSSISTMQWFTGSVRNSSTLTFCSSPNSIFCSKWEIEMNWEWKKQDRIRYTHQPVSPLMHGRRAPLVASRVGAKIWNETPNSFKTYQRRTSEKRIKGALLNVLKAEENYIDNGKIVAKLKE